MATADVERGPRHGGCAGCTTARTNGGELAVGGLFGLAFLLVARRKRHPR